MLGKYEYLLKVPLVRIENRSQYIVQQPHYHPITKQYKQFKIQQIEKCIYGMWGKESKGYRWLPPFGYFYANYVKIAQETDNKEEVTEKAKLDDLEWMLSYLVAEAYGFSGFEKDDEYSCDRALIDDYEMVLAKKQKSRYNHLYNSKGELKKYIEVQEYLYKLHEKDLGKALWYNEANDAIIMGSRASGKTYFMVGLTLWFMVFDGTKSIGEEWIKLKISANVIMGAAEDLPTQEFCRRLEIAMNCLLNDEDLGAYKIPGADVIPLLGRHMLGKTHDYWRYRIIINGVESGGTGSSFRPVAYSANKRGGGATSAASVRVHLSIMDEIGKFAVSPISIWGSNRALTRRNTQFGVQLLAGTSGNLELVQEAKKIFENPKDFNMVSFKNSYSSTPGGKIGFFIPAFLTKRDFKDEDGNTLVADALEFFVKRRANCATIEVLAEEMMNYPIEVEDMWIQKKGSIFSKEQIRKRLQQLTLMKNQGREDSFRRFAKLTWNNNDVDIEWIDSKKAVTIDSFHDSQGDNAKKKNVNTDIIIYELPEENAPDDLYLFSCDTYVAEEKDEGSSLGSIFVYKNPKYVSKGFTGNIIVAEYTGKPDNRNIFYDNLLKLITLYGSKKRCLMFEANRGADKLTEYFKKRNKEHLLAFTPDKYRNQWKQGMSNKYGYLITAESKTELLTYFSEWLMEENEQEDGIKLNVERICSIGLLSELLAYDYERDKSKKDNYDRIMSFLGCLIAKREVINEFIKIETKGRSIYDAFSERSKKYKLKNNVLFGNTRT